MRIYALILSLLFCVASAFAKDVITKTDGTKLDAKVEEITETIIKYRKASNLTGPVYTIPISSVATVHYENGDIDTFNNTTTNTTTVSSNQTVSPSDDDLMRLADSQAYDNQSGSVSDSQLLKIYNSGMEVPQDLKSKVKTYRKIGWYGGAALVVVGVTCGIIITGSEGDPTIGNLIGISMAGVGAGAIWCAGFNLKANSLMKQVRQMQSYSKMLLENEVMQFGDNKLTAGINLMGNRMVNSHCLGVSLGLNF